MADSSDDSEERRVGKERRKVSIPVEHDRRQEQRRDLHDWGAQLNRETAALGRRVAALTGALTEIGRIQDRQMQLEEDIRLANEETRDLNELVTHEHIRRQHRTYAVIVVVSVLASLITLGIGAAVYNAVKPAEAFDPFTFPTQTVSDRYHGSATPAVHVGDLVHVTATKCSSAKKPVTEQGSTVWSLTKPPGTVITVSTGASGKVQPGCQTKSYENVMPPEVVKRTRELAAAGIKAIWTVNGVERPLQAGGVAEGWHTEPFEVVP